MTKKLLLQLIFVGTLDAYEFDSFHETDVDNWLVHNLAAGKRGAPPRVLLANWN